MTEIVKQDNNTGKVPNYKENIPNLRFPEFTDYWKVKNIKNLGGFIGGGTPDTAIEKFWEGKIPWISSSDIAINDIHNIQKTRFITENAIKSSATKLIPKGGILMVSRVGIGKFAVADEELCTSQDFTNLITTENEYFLCYYFSARSNSFVRLSQGTSIKGFTIQDVKAAKFFIPSVKEQDKISSFLSLIDSRIETQNKIIEELKLLKNTIRYQLYTHILNEENELVQIKELLNYEQPTKYLVTNTDYSSDLSLTPVLTANKAFILGYTNEVFGVYNKNECIIFDDFTMGMKFVNFPFKVKSSAIKILTAKPTVNLKFIFEYLSFLNLSSNEHKRHYISEIESMEIILPDCYNQNQIANILSSIEKKIEIESKIEILLVNQKKYFLTNLFI